MMENTNANGDETGVGAGLSGADLTLTAHGTIAGASGTPPSRQTTSGWFTPSTAWPNYFFSTGNAWAIVFKLSNWTGTANEVLFRVATADGMQEMQLSRASSKLRFFAQINGSLLGGAMFSTTNNIPTSGVVYCAMWYDGSYVRGGFSTTKPTTWSSFASGDRAVTTATASSMFSGYTWSSTYTAFLAGSAGGSSPVSSCLPYYFAVSKNSALIGA